MNKSEIIQFFQSFETNPKKYLSQHFLIDQQIIAKCAALAEIRSGDKVLEIGPGLGVITKHLLDLGAKVVAIEKDPLLAKHLERLQTFDQRLQVYTADILTFPLKIIGKSCKVVSNIPFKITAPILEILCKNSDQFCSFTLIVQHELANRINAQPKTKEFGSLTLFLQFYTKCIGVFPISASNFYPRPNVNAAAIHLKCHPPPIGIDPESFFSLIRKAFQQRRKMLTSSLRDLLPTLKATLQELNISSNSRPEELNLEEWLQLFNRTNNNLKFIKPVKLRH